MPRRCPSLVVAGMSLVAIFSAASPLRAQDLPAPQSAPPAPASATPTASPPTITTDRPAITDASTVVPAGYFVFENGFAQTSSQGQNVVDAPESLVRFGLTAKTELRFTAPDYFNDFSAGSVSGWGDLSLGVKQQLFATKSNFDASLVVSLSFPTGAHAISSHGYDPSVLLPWSVPLSKNWTAAGMFSVLWPTVDRRRNVTGQASFYLDRQITGKWDAFLEYGGEYPQRGGPQHIIHAGTSYKLTPNQQLDFHFGFGLSAAAPDHFIGFGYSFQLQALRREKPSGS